jgi:hypothetical protein
MIQNKDHWYDGWFYDKLIAPNQDRLFVEIKKIIEPNTTIIDVGCGTGRFIDKANQTLSKNQNKNISFQHTNLTDLITQNSHYDYAVMTYVIHEVDPEDRITLLKEMAQIADKIIIGDYLVPGNKGFWSLLNEVVEFLAGKDHYNNFKNFSANGGLYGLVDAAELRVVQEMNNKPATNQLMVLTTK